MNLWETIAVGDRDGPGFPGPGDTLTRAEARDMTAIRIGALEGQVYELRRLHLGLHEVCAGLAAQVAELGDQARAVGARSS